jgi:HemY protein
VAIVAARAAHELRAYDRRDAHLALAAEGAPEEDALRAVTGAELLLDERRPEEALELLALLPRKHTAALRLELKARQLTRQWENVRELAGELERREVLDHGQAMQLRALAAAELLKRKAIDPHAFDEAWQKLTDNERRTPLIAAAAARCVMQLGRADEAQQMIEQALERNWDSELVALYAECAGSATVRQIERAESWLVQHPNDAALLLTLGALCAKQALWGKAQSYIEASLSVEESHVAHLALARLQEKLGNDAAARQHYGRSLDLALALLHKREAPKLPKLPREPLRAQPAQPALPA